MSARGAFVYNLPGMVLDKLKSFKMQATDGGEFSGPTGADLTVQPVDLRGRDFGKILLIKLSAVGDVVHTLPVLNKLRHRYPKARLDWLVRPAIADLLRQNPAIDNVIDPRARSGRGAWRRLLNCGAARRHAARRPVRSGARPARPAAQRRLRLRLRRSGAHRVRPAARGAVEHLSANHPGRGEEGTLGRARAREVRLAYTHHIPLPTLDAHPVERYLGVAPMLGLDEGAADFSFPIPPEASARIDALADYYGIAGTKLVALAPATNWETKQWRSDGFAEVARHFLKKGFGVVLIGSDRERGTCEDVARLAPGTVNLAGETTLSELAALIRRTTISVTNDSGPMHLAVALDRPVVGIFGPTDTVWAGPYRRDGAVLRTELPCSPCYLRQLSRCNFGHACMQQVGAGAVIERAESILAKLPSRTKPAAPPTSPR